MSTSVTAGASKPTPGLTGAHDEWVKDTLGRDPKTYKASDLEADGSLRQATPANGKAAAPRPAPSPAAESSAAGPAAAAPAEGGGMKGAAGKLKGFISDHVSVEVKEVGENDPPTYVLTTTIHFELGKDASAGGKRSAGELEDSAKANMKDGASSYGKASKTYTQRLSQAEAQAYVDCIKNHGKGGNFPEMEVLRTAADKSWAAAQELAGAGNAPKAGDEVTTEFEAGSNVKASYSRQMGPVKAGVETRASAHHKVSIKQKVDQDGTIHFTVSVDDAADGTAGGSAEIAQGGAHGKLLREAGIGQTGELTLHTDNPKFDELRQSIIAVKTLDALEAVVKANHDLVESTTQRSHSGKGNEFGMFVNVPSGKDKDGKDKATKVDLTLADKGTLDLDTKRDRDGKLIEANAASEARSGATLEIDGKKVGVEDSSTYKGHVDADGQVTGESGHHSRSTDLLGSVAHAAKSVAKSAVKGDMKAIKEFKATDHIVEDENVEGLVFGDKQFMAVCQAAVDPGKWMGIQGGGYMLDEWVEVGKKLRAAMTVKHGKIVDVDKVAANAAIAEWNNSDKGGDRKSVMDRIMRPFGGEAAGKGFDFPGETKALKKPYDQYVVGDPLAAAKKLIAAGKPRDAVLAMMAAKKALTGLKGDMAKQEKSWEGHETEYAEMLDHLGRRLNEIGKAVSGMKSAQAAPASGPAAPAPAAPDNSAELEAFNGNKADMQRYHDTAFNKVNEAKKVLEGGSSPSVAFREFGALIKQVEDLLENWQRKYDETYKLFEKLSPTMALDKAALERLHPHGAREYCAKTKKDATKY